MKNVLPVIAAAVVLTGSAALAAATQPATSMSATMGNDAYDCSTVTVTAEGADLDADAFTATANGTGGCTLTFKDKAPKSYTATVKDSNGLLITFKLQGKTLVKVPKPGASADAKFIGS